MSTIHRYMPSWALPKYVFVPGSNPHPKKDGGHMVGEGDPLATPINPAAPEKNEFLRFALDLYNHGFYWESHVYFEALWNAHKRVGSTADFLKALIKLGAAGVKRSIEQQVAATGHNERARELLESVRKTEGDEYLGFNLKQLLNEIQAKDFVVEIHPSWK